MELKKKRDTYDDHDHHLAFNVKEHPKKTDAIKEGLKEIEANQDYPIDKAVHHHLPHKKGRKQERDTETLKPRDLETQERPEGKLAWGHIIDPVPLGTAICNELIFDCKIKV